MRAQTFPALRSVVGRSLLLAVVIAAIAAPVALASAPLQRVETTAVQPRPQPRLQVRVVGARAIPTGAVERGIDVSHWQGTIDWPTAHAAGVSFAWIKATEGTSFVDPQFAVNRPAAAAAGVRVGAYHYARPSLAPYDAILEADFFLATVQPVRGELVPALDLEETGGLTPVELTTWTLGFVARVREHLGVSPVIYTSPAFWAANLADTEVVALWDAPLWLAHWNTADAWVPASRWRGRGWSVWQWSDAGLVPGIDGRVDLDVVASGGLEHLTLR